MSWVHRNHMLDLCRGPLHPGGVPRTYRRVLAPECQPNRQPAPLGACPAYEAQRRVRPQRCGPPAGYSAAGRTPGSTLRPCVP